MKSSVRSRKTTHTLSRRTLLRHAAAGAFGLSVPFLHQQPSTGRNIRAFNDDPLLQLTLVETAARLHAGRLEARALAEAVLAAERRYANLNVYTTLDAYRLRRSASDADAALKRGDTIGPLHGVPLILKDNINTRALPTSGGTPGLRNNHPGTDAPVATRLFQAGALLAGKANLHELSSGGTSNNHTFGAVGNPYDLDRIPGGSSGGTAAAVAAYMMHGGLGTDTGGSVRVPAALCGVVGLRPTTGRYPSGGIVPLSPSLDTAGPIARNVADIALLDAVITGEINTIDAPSPASIRLGVPYDSLLADAGDNIMHVIERALASLQHAGVTLVPVKLSAIKKLTTKAFGALIGYEFRTAMADYLERYTPGLDVDELTAQVASKSAKRMLAGRSGRTINRDFYQKTIDEYLPELKRMHAILFEAHQIDALAFPTTPEVALPRTHDDSVFRDGESAFSWFYFGHTSLASVAGNPSLTLPAGLSNEGLPVGLSLDGLPGTDRKILGIGKTVERLVAT
jgi:Asp-tRNA(Asn)/Glu-tRNA(Gln) amidotransferase A subunit family amidase